MKQPIEECTGCGKRRSVRKWIGDGPYCRDCAKSVKPLVVLYNPPNVWLDSCSQCSQNAVIVFPCEFLRKDGRVSWRANICVDCLTEELEKTAEEALVPDDDDEEEEASEEDDSSFLWASI